ncbi:hypothetical protein [Streptomyces anulatus]|uniref:hypothetical protein n=1 Tax=Streptomyces anulatus TaxID=1892 RepID=UPI002F92F4E2|nr:hypothetical protein OHB50_39780 [Streptomyces anulatus]
MSTTDPFALLRAAAAVQRLDYELTIHPGDRLRERTYLVHRAALADRTVPVPALADVENPEASEQDAEGTARRLLEHDRTHGTGHGPVPAADPRWNTDARGYARQEHAAAVRDEHDQEHACG